jgi:BASS family bile acid:Na+ symporter
MESIIQIFAIVVIPVSIGMLIRYYKPNFALKMGEPVRKASGIVIGLIIIGIAIKEKHNIIPYFQQAGLVALLLNISTMAIGFYSAKLFQIKDKRSISISIESGIQNGTLAISIAVVLLRSSELAIMPAIYSLLMFFTAGFAIYAGIRKDKKLQLQTENTQAR